jgi:hypothetical protein
MEEVQCEDEVCHVSRRDNAHVNCIGKYGGMEKRPKQHFMRESDRLRIY